MTKRVVKKPVRHLVRYGRNNMGNRHYPAPIAKVENQMFYDQKALNTKTGKRYVRIYRNLLKNEHLDKKMLAHMNKQSKHGESSSAVPFKPVNKKVAPKWNNKYCNNFHLATVIPRKGIKVEAIKLGNTDSNSKAVGAKVLKHGTKLYVQSFGRSNGGFVVKNNKLLNKGYLWGYKLGYPSK